MDDVLIVSKSVSVVQSLKKVLSKGFVMKDLSLVKKILGIKIFRDKSNGILHLSRKGIHRKYWRGLE